MSDKTIFGIPYIETDHAQKLGKIVLGTLDAYTAKWKIHPAWAMIFGIWHAEWILGLMGCDPEKIDDGCNDLYEEVK